MAAPAASWNLVRVYGTWHKQDGSLMGGTYRVVVPQRVTNATDDVIIPAGEFTTGALTTGGAPSLDVLVPATDDADNQQTGWKLRIEVTLDSGGTEVYDLDVPIAHRPVGDGGDGAGVNLRTVVLSQPSTPPALGAYKVGVPGGLARLDASGQVVDANGDPVTGGGGGGTPGADGKSAKEIATESGAFPGGTDEQFSQWLKGEKGDPGLKGDPGGPGAQGPTGPAMQILFRGSDGSWPTRPSAAAVVWACADTPVTPPEITAGDQLLVYDSSSSV